MVETFEPRGKMDRQRDTSHDCNAEVTPREAGKLLTIPQ